MEHEWMSGFFWGLGGGIVTTVVVLIGAMAYDMRKFRQ